MNRANRGKTVVLLFLSAVILAGTPAFAQSPGIDFSGEWTQWIQQGEGDPRMQEVGDIVNMVASEAVQHMPKRHCIP